MNFKINNAYENVPFEMYLDVPFMSNTQIGYLSTMKHYLAKIAKPIDNKGMMEGRLLHSLIIEGKNEFVVEKEHNPNRRKKEYQDWKKNQLLPIITKDQHRDFINMRTAIESHPLIEHLFDDSFNIKKELSLFFKYYGVDCKSRLDILDKDKSIIYDLKFITKELTDFNLDRMIYDYGYYRQAAFYLQAYKACYDKYGNFKFIFVEKDFPHGIRVVSLTKDYLAKALNVINSRLDYYLKNKDKEIMPAYPEMEYKIDAPAWL